MLSFPLLENNQIERLESQPHKPLQKKVTYSPNTLKPWVFKYIVRYSSFTHEWKLEKEGNCSTYECQLYYTACFNGCHGISTERSWRKDGVWLLVDEEWILLTVASVFVCCGVWKLPEVPYVCGERDFKGDFKGGEELIVLVKWPYYWNFWLLSALSEAR